MPDTLARHLLSLTRAQAALEALDDRRLCTALAEWAESWRGTESHWRSRAMHVLPSTTGLSPEGVAWGLEACFGALDEASLLGLAARRYPLGPVQPGSVGTSFHVWCEAPFIAGIFGIVRALIARSPCLIRPSTREPLFAGLVAESLSRSGTELEGLVAHLPWPSADVGLTQQAMEGAGAVLASGSDESIRALRGFVSPGTRFVGYGHRFSVCLVCREYAANPTEELLLAIARDVLAYDGAGCLSPKAIWLEEGEDVDPHAFAEALFQKGMPKASAGLPPGSGHLLRSGQRAQRLSLLEMSGPVWRAQGFAVAMPLGGASDGPGRTAMVRRLPQASFLPELLGRLAGRLQGVSLAAPPERREQLISVLAGTGTSRICSPGALQMPRLDWPQDGLSPLEGLVHSLSLD